jgi:hypothetical protein
MIYHPGQLGSANNFHHSLFLKLQSFDLDIIPIRSRMPHRPLWWRIRLFLLLLNRVLSSRFCGTVLNQWGAYRNKWPSWRTFEVASSLGSDIARTKNSVVQPASKLRVAIRPSKFPNGSTSTGRRWRVRLQRGRGTYHGEEERKSWRRYFI